MNPFDMVIIVILGYCLILGISRGFIREVAAIIAVVGGFAAAYSGYDSMAPLIAGFIETPVYQEILAFIVIFFCVCLVVTVLGMLLRLLVKVALLGAVDRFFGAVLGALKGMVVISLLFILLITFLPVGGKQVVADSRMAPVINSVSKSLVHVIPQAKRRAFMHHLEAIKKNWSAGPVGESGENGAPD